VMTAEVRYCYDDQNLDEVSAIMGDIQVRRLPVLNRDKRLVAASLRWATSRWRKPATARARR
jgi:CBS domain-containing protein